MFADEILHPAVEHLWDLRFHAHVCKSCLSSLFSNTHLMASLQVIPIHPACQSLFDITKKATRRRVASKPEENFQIRLETA